MVGGSVGTDYMQRLRYRSNLWTEYLTNIGT